MGTNYYVRTNYCEHCKRHDSLHIGKASHGWAFSFQGFPEFDLVSWKSWKIYLRDKSIVDEYGEEIEYEWFCNMVETEKSPYYVNENGKKNLQHNMEGRKEGWFNPVHDWDCNDGYSFHNGEFI